MRFIIQDGMPFLISGGRAFPVEITENKDVIIDKESGRMAEENGYLTLDEVVAKIGYTKTQDPQEEKKSRKTKSNLS